MTDAEQDDLNERFDTSLDDATHAIITEFEWLGGLPENEELGELMVRINDALTAIMGAYR